MDMVVVSHTRRIDSQWPFDSYYIAEIMVNLGVLTNMNRDVVFLEFNNGIDSMRGIGIRYGRGPKESGSEQRGILI